MSRFPKDVSDVYCQCDKIVVVSSLALILKGVRRHVSIDHGRRILNASCRGVVESGLPDKPELFHGGERGEIRRAGKRIGG